MFNNKIFIIGTPIGNLKDITLRALETLKEVEIILCEDTRVTSKLLNHFKIENKKLLSYHKFNEKEMISKIFNLFHEGKKIALVSDAGMPKISDPGFWLIEKCYEENIQLELIPGVSSFVSSYVLSPFNGHFTFLGFLKDKSSQRTKQLENLNEGIYIIYVSPHKLISTLIDIDKVFGNDVKIFLSKEITKLYEKHYFGSPKDIMQNLPSTIKGEYTLCFKFEKPKEIRIKKNKYEKFSKFKNQNSIK
ncbi:16S rRNA (cytidine(1402)-2'-O)-methyltransferase [Mesomycoplasma molare]|uniref:Ribosomal RNA small subunit methyltransferase I n=1 Tax=Mesomycoplasma molare TaxID=171288 RepID=A0ABY5TTD8_9BACT|nr:16S rRNA (cytidine(1402)-2'-O)-methyltransferase [Mesomycoplasma molare]UWD33932.1 16S rRNA (cytidine(1402)-2'-O)-methyltransferase [Mesomycoplasma molare]